ncbi:hypothetical protein HDU96_006993 [Phlyctochytrium bullatum]|nr:hypothetical protein HDU96_006993 [Phlyctochytrium bullatum]
MVGRPSGSLSSLSRAAAVVSDDQTDDGQSLMMDHGDRWADLLSDDLWILVACRVASHDLVAFVEMGMADRRFRRCVISLSVSVASYKLLTLVLTGPPSLRVTATNICWFYAYRSRYPNLTRSFAYRGSDPEPPDWRTKLISSVTADRAWKSFGDRLVSRNGWTSGYPSPYSLPMSGFPGASQQTSPSLSAAAMHVSKAIEGLALSPSSASAASVSPYLSPSQLHGTDMTGVQHNQQASSASGMSNGKKLEDDAPTSATTRTPPPPPARLSIPQVIPPRRNYLHPGQPQQGAVSPTGGAQHHTPYFGPSTSSRPTPALPPSHNHLYNSNSIPVPTVVDMNNPPTSLPPRQHLLNPPSPLNIPPPTGTAPPPPYKGGDPDAMDADDTFPDALPSPSAMARRPTMASVISSTASVHTASSFGTVSSGGSGLSSASNASALPRRQYRLNPIDGRVEALMDPSGAHHPSQSTGPGPSPHPIHAPSPPPPSSPVSPMVVGSQGLTVPVNLPTAQQYLPGTPQAAAAAAAAALYLRAAAAGAGRSRSPSPASPLIGRSQSPMPNVFGRPVSPSLLSPHAQHGRSQSPAGWRGGPTSPAPRMRGSAFPLPPTSAGADGTGSTTVAAQNQVPVPPSPLYASHSAQSSPSPTPSSAPMTPPSLAPSLSGSGSAPRPQQQPRAPSPLPQTTPPFTGCSLFLGEREISWYLLTCHSNPDARFAYASIVSEPAVPSVLPDGGLAVEAGTPPSSGTRSSPGQPPSSAESGASAAGPMSPGGSGVRLMRKHGPADGGADGAGGVGSGGSSIRKRRMERARCARGRAAMAPLDPPVRTGMWGDGSVMGVSVLHRVRPSTGGAGAGSTANRPRGRRRSRIGEEEEEEEEVPSVATAAAGDGESEDAGADLRTSVFLVHVPTQRLIAGTSFRTSGPERSWNWLVLRHLDVRRNLMIMAEEDDRAGRWHRLVFRRCVEGAGYLDTEVAKKVFAFPAAEEDAALEPPPGSELDEEEDDVAMDDAGGGVGEAGRKISGASTSSSGSNGSSPRPRSGIPLGPSSYSRRRRREGPRHLYTTRNWVDHVASSQDAGHLSELLLPDDLVGYSIVPFPANLHVVPVSSSSPAPSIVSSTPPQTGAPRSRQGSLMEVDEEPENEGSASMQVPENGASTETSSGRPALSVFTGGAAGKQPADSFERRNSNASGIVPVGFDPTEAVLVLCVTKDEEEIGTILSVDVRDGRIISRACYGRNVTAIDVGIPYENVVVTGHSDHKVRVWDFVSGVHLLSFQCPLSPNPVLGISWVDEPECWRFEDLDGEGDAVQGDIDVPNKENGEDGTRVDEVLAARSRRRIPWRRPRGLTLVSFADLDDDDESEEGNGPAEQDDDDETGTGMAGPTQLGGGAAGAGGPAAGNQAAFVESDQRSGEFVVWDLERFIKTARRNLKDRKRLVPQEGLGNRALPVPLLGGSSSVAASPTHSLASMAMPSPTASSNPSFQRIIPPLRTSSMNVPVLSRLRVRGAFPGDEVATFTVIHPYVLVLTTGGTFEALNLETGESVARITKVVARAQAAAAASAGAVAAAAAASSNVPVTKALEAYYHQQYNYHLQLQQHQAGGSDGGSELPSPTAMAAAAVAAASATAAAAASTGHTALARTLSTISSSVSRNYSIMSNTSTSSDISQAPTLHFGGIEGRGVDGRHSGELRRNWTASTVASDATLSSQADAMAGVAFSIANLDGQRMDSQPTSSSSSSSASLPPPQVMGATLAQTPTAAAAQSQFGIYSVVRVPGVGMLLLTSGGILRLDVPFKGF